MAEFVDVIKNFNRMCESGDCRIEIMEVNVDDLVHTCNVDYCQKFAFGRPEDFEKIVTDWATEHPEPKLPTMAEYLERFGIYIKRDGTMHADFFKANEPMSEETAKKLGIKE